MRPMGSWSAVRRLSAVALALGIFLPVERAHAYPGLGNAVCHLLGGAVLVGSGLVDLGFTGYAIHQGLRTPPYPPSDVAKAQLGLTIPQLVLSAALVGPVGMACENKKLAILYFGAPMAWSLALIGHGAWALHSNNQEGLSSSTPALSMRVRFGSRAF